MTCSIDPKRPSCVRGRSWEPIGILAVFELAVSNFSIVPEPVPLQARFPCLQPVRYHCVYPGQLGVHVSKKPVFLSKLAP